MIRAYFGGEPKPAERGRIVIYKAMCDLLWTLWGLIQHANKNPVDDFWAYAIEPLRALQDADGDARLCAPCLSGERRLTIPRPRVGVREGARRAGEGCVAIATRSRRLHRRLRCKPPALIRRCAPPSPALAGEGKAISYSAAFTRARIVGMGRPVGVVAADLSGRYAGRCPRSSRPW